MVKDNLRLNIISKSQGIIAELQSYLGDDCENRILPTVNIKQRNLFKGKIILVFEELLYLIKLFCSPTLYSSGNKFVCSSHHYSTLFFCKIMSLFGKKHQIYLLYLYIHGLGEKKIIQVILKYLFSQRVGILTQSESEINYFKKICSTVEIRYFPYCSDDITNSKSLNIVQKDYFFSGGYTNRDYQLLIQCAAQLPDAQFVIVCSRLNNLPGIIPDNVKIYKELSSEEFHSLMAGSRAVVIPLKDDVGSSGQMVALAAMQMKKTIIYPNFDVVSQYFEDKVSGLMYQAGDIDSLVGKLNFVISAEEQLPEMGIRARERWALYFRKENFMQAVTEHIYYFFGEKITR